MNRKRIQWNLHMAKKKILDIFFPASCPVCGEVVRGKEEYICASCRDKLTVIKGPVCMKCGRPLTNDVDEWCESCRKEKHFYRRAFSLYLYNDGMRQSIYRFKYKNCGEYAFYYGREMVRHKGAANLHKQYDAIIPVPLHKKKMRSRGFNQAELIAKEISLRAQVPLHTKLLTRTKETAPMKDLNRLERKKNMRGAFAIASAKQERIPERILLIDDIYTTGATADACAGVLLKNGAKVVDCYCLAMEM